MDVFVFFVAGSIVGCLWICPFCWAFVMVFFIFLFYKAFVLWV